MVMACASGGCACGNAVFVLAAFAGCCVCHPCRTCTFFSVAAPTLRLETVMLRHLCTSVTVLWLCPSVLHTRTQRFA